MSRTPTSRPSDQPAHRSRRTVLRALGGVTALSAATAIGSRSTARALGTVDVTAHGADPTGTADSTAAITAADAVARTSGDTVWFPSGTYSAYGLRPGASWAGAPGAVIVNRSPGLDKFGFVRITGQTGIGFTGLTFDGSVSPDPTTWDATSINSWSGAIPCFVENSSHLSFSQCIFRNGVRSGLRLHDCSDTTITSCTFTHIRDPWADGSYVSGCARVSYVDCAASDHTRIGFVADAATRGNTGISYHGCTADHGHHASVLYGGSEYNAGFWTENSTGTTFDTCTATDQTHYGFCLQTGDLTPGSGSVTVESVDCGADECGSGVKLGSFGVRPLTATVTRMATTVQSATGAGAVATLRHDADAIHFVDCSSVIDGGTAVSSATHLSLDDGGVGTAGHVSLDDCRFEWQGAQPRTQDILVHGSSRAVIDLTDVACAPYGCVAVATTPTTAPVVTAHGTTLLC